MAPGTPRTPNGKGARLAKSRAEKVARSPLPPEEWDFREFLIPEDELLACVLYEYAREAAASSAELQSKLNELAASLSAPKGSTKRARQFTHYLNIGRLLQSPLGSPHIRADMLSVPWRKLAEAERDMAKQRARPRRDGDSAHFTETFPLGSSAFRDAALHDFAVSFTGMQTLFRSDVSGLEFGFFAVDWNFPQDAIESEFRTWLGKQLAGRDRKSIPYSRRGRVKTDAPRSWLKALGAKRLTDSRMTFPQARDYSAQLAREPLFRAKEEWSKAKRDALQRVRTLFPALA